MSNIVTFKAKSLPAGVAELFDVNEIGDDLSSGVTGGFAVVSIRGSKWRIKYQGDETPVLNEDGEPVPSIEVVMLKASPNVSRIYYAKSFEEGDAEEPDCYSLDGIKPEAGCRSKQADNCAVCPRAVWGSKITPAGKKAKACQDNRRMAIVPAGDIENEVNGGAMLLRVPAASLGDLSVFGKQMKGKGYPYNAIATRIGFDMNASYPKLTFKAVRALTEDELVQVAAHLRSDRLHEILNQAHEVAAAPAAEPEEAPSVDTDFEEEPEQVVAKPKAKPKAKAKPAAKKPAPASKPSEDDGEDDEMNDALDSILSDLDGLA